MSGHWSRPWPWWRWYLDVVFPLLLPGVWRPPNLLRNLLQHTKGIACARAGGYTTYPRPYLCPRFREHLIPEARSGSRLLEQVAKRFVVRWFRRGGAGDPVDLRKVSVEQLPPCGLDVSPHLLGTRRTGYN